MKLPTGTTGWTTYQINMTAPSNYTKIQVILQYSRSQGFAWFDNFVMVNP
jgi:hypothetical protein